MATVLDTFITRFGFETDTKGLKTAEKGLDDLKATAFRVASVVGSIIGGGFLVTRFVQATLNTEKLANALGFTVEQMSELEFIAQKLNVPIETLRGQAFNLAQALNEAATTGAGISDDLTRFGLSAKDASGKTKDLATFIDEVRIKMQGLNTIEQADLADKLFFDEETIALLKATPGLIAEITKQAKELGVLTRQDAAKAKEFQDGLINIRFGIRNIQTTVGNLVFDKLTGMFETINEWLKLFEKHEKKIVKALKVIGKAFLTMAAYALISWGIALGPPALIAAAIGLISTAIWALIDDYKAFKKGHKSAIGDALKEWPKLATFVENVGKAFRFTLEQANLLWDLLPKIGKSIKESLGFDTEDFERKSFFTKEFFNFDPELQKRLFDKEKGLGSLTDPINRTENQDNLGGQLPITNNTNTSPILQRTNNITIEAINVDARGGDSEEIAANAGKELGTAIKDTVNNFDSGIDK